MSDNPVKVSIIMPTYNVEPYFRQAIESVLRQSLTEIEIIPVDDGSPDNCAAIMDEYAAKDHRVKPIHKENGGYGSAVNAGIKAARGEYVAIVEPDDYIIDDLYYILYHTAAENDLDICRFNSYLEIREYMTPMLRQTYYPGDHDILSEQQLAEMFALTHPGVWMGIYRRTLLLDNDVWMDEQNKAYHDVDFVALAYLAARRIKIVQTCGYYYRRDVPTQSVNDIGKAYCVIDAVRRLWREVSNRVVSDRLRPALLGYSLGHLLHYYKRVSSAFPCSPLADVLKKEIIITVRGSSEILSTVSVARFLKAEFDKVNVAVVETSAERTLKNLPSVKVLRQDGGNSLKEILSICYLKMALLMEGRDRESVSLMAGDVWPIIVGTVGLYNKSIINMVRLILEVYPQKFLLWERPDYYARLLSYLIECGDDIAIELFWSSKNVNAAIEREMMAYPYAVEIIAQKKPMKATASIRYFSNTRSRIAESEFIRFIEGKSIAVVGNSPCELGRGKGAEIDRHDLVIRFNNYVVNEALRCDYGSKEDMWVISPNISLVERRVDISKYRFISTSVVGRECSIQNQEFYSELSQYSQFFRMDRQFSGRFGLDCVFPSLGVYTLVYLSDFLNSVAKISLFGFALTDHEDGKRHYFEGDPHKATSKIHNWQRERNYLERFSEAANVEYSR